MKKVMTITVTAITILSVACQTKQEKPFSLVPQVIGFHYLPFRATQPTDYLLNTRHL